MSKRLSMRRALSACTILAVTMITPGAGRAADTTLTLLIDNGAQTVPVIQKLVSEFEAHNPGIKVDVETRPGGTEGDNIIKTRLATGDMTDLFLYNSGSLFNALNPPQNLTDLTEQPFAANVADVYRPAVGVAGQLYGIPVQTAMGGGVFYNRKIYAALGLQVPKTWAAFMANNAKIKAAGTVPVIQTFKDSWTSQLFVLGDFYNVQRSEPDFAERYTTNKAKFATDPLALRGFQHQADVLLAGDLNPDYAAATYEEGLRMLATGKGAHYPMLTFAIAALQQNFKDQLKEIGFFALPGDDAAKNGLTSWLPFALYLNKSSEHQGLALKFLAFVASPEGCAAQTAAVGVTGPYMIKNCPLPADVPPSVTDLLGYFATPATSLPALEYVSPVKGPSLEQITVEVGSGITAPAAGAALYDEDVKKQAQQLGLPNW